MEEVFVATEGMIQEQYDRAAAMISDIRELINRAQDHESMESRYAYLQSVCNYYELSGRIYKTRLEVKSRLHVPCKYEIHGIMQAMLISLEAMSEEELEPADESDRFYDPEWIRQTAGQFHEHYKKTAAKNNCVIS